MLILYLLYKFFIHQKLVAHKNTKKLILFIYSSCHINNKKIQTFV